MVHSHWRRAAPAAAAVPRRQRPRAPRRAAPLAVLAMVNVDFASPSLVLGTALIGCGVALLQARSLHMRVSRDADIVVAAMISIVGSTLIFQGWRLDPLLLLCQALTTSVAFWYGLETFKLRSKVAADEEQAQQPPAQLLPPPADALYDYPGFEGTQARRPEGFLPAAGERPPAPWEPPVQQQQWQQQQWQQQQWQQQEQQQYSGRWGPPAAAQGGEVYGTAWPAAAERQYPPPTIRYDYYGNPQEGEVFGGYGDAVAAGAEGFDTPTQRAGFSGGYGGGSDSSDDGGAGYGVNSAAGYSGGGSSGAGTGDGDAYGSYRASALGGAGEVGASGGRVPGAYGTPPEQSGAAAPAFAGGTSGGAYSSQRQGRSSSSSSSAGRPAGRDQAAGQEPVGGSGATGWGSGAQGGGYEKVDDWE